MQMRPLRLHTSAYRIDILGTLQYSNSGISTALVAVSNINIQQHSRANMASSVYSLSVEEIKANPKKFLPLLNHCQILPSNFTLPQHGKFDFVCLRLLDINTKEQCEAFTGARLVDWKQYISVDVWDRIEVWKIPLVLLIIQFPHTPLALHTHIFTIFHLLGDPVHTIGSLLYTLAACQERAMLLKTHLGDPGSSNWKIYALILTSYDECGNRGNVTEFIKQLMYAKTFGAETVVITDSTRTKLESDRQRYAKVRAVFLKTARDLAADRQTKSLPVIYALGLFTHAFGFAFYKINVSDKASLSNPNGKYVNIEAHSIAFSALLLWLMPAVYFASIIGVSQTGEQIPDKLNDFRNQLMALKETSDFPDISEEFPAHIYVSNSGRGHGYSHTNQFAPLDNSLRFTSLRYQTGGIYSCQPALVSKENALPDHARLTWRTRFWCQTVAWLQVSSGVAVAIIISYGVPPVGNMCRIWGEISALLLWFVSWVADFLISWLVAPRHQYKCMFVKDAIAGSGIFVLIIVTQVGIFNRCGCFSDRAGRVKNPLDWVVEAVLDHKFIKEWLPTVMGGVVLGVILSAVASWWFMIGSRVYLQKSDGRSNLDQLWLVGGPLKSIFQWLERCRLQIKPWKEVKSEVKGVFEEMVSFLVHLLMCFRLIGN
jgi:hypothetical protein